MTDSVHGPSSRFMNQKESQFPRTTCLVSRDVVQLVGNQGRQVVILRFLHTKAFYLR